MEHRRRRSRCSGGSRKRGGSCRTGRTNGVLQARARLHQQDPQGAKPANLPIEQPTKFDLSSISRPPRCSASPSRNRYCCARTRDSVKAALSSAYSPYDSRVAIRCTRAEISSPGHRFLSGQPPGPRAPTLPRFASASMRPAMLKTRRRDRISLAEGRYDRLPALARIWFAAKSLSCSSGAAEFGKPRQRLRPYQLCLRRGTIPSRPALSPSGAPGWESTGVSFVPAELAASGWNSCTSWSRKRPRSGWS